MARNVFISFQYADGHEYKDVTAQKSCEKSAPRFEGFGSESWRTGANKSTKQKEEKHMYCKPTINSY